MQLNAITGHHIPLLETLKRDLLEASKVKFIISFILESGVHLIINELELLSQKGIKIEILTGTYLNVTEPPALYFLKHRLGSNCDIRFYNEKKISFHSKGYLIEKGQEAVAIIGSSNLSYSALVSGVEWNYRLEKKTLFEDYMLFDSMFDNLFSKAQKVTDEVLKSYANSWRKSIFSKETICENVVSFRPKGAQIEALYCLEQSRAEGISKGLVIAATGIGKTYLAAFDSQNFKRVLFVAHREEILKQAAESFSNVRPNNVCTFFYGARKERSGDIIFATVQTLSQSIYLNESYFSEDHFDYIVIDEFHHAAADGYRKILQYFKPKFLLGLTATPYRMDNRDIFSLCDHNVVYEIYLKDAINRGYLSPFRYYAFYDETKYDEIEQVGGHYQIEQLERALSTKSRAFLVLEKYKQHAGQKTIGFCVSIAHAEYMAEYFSKEYISACVVHSGSTKSVYYLNRHDAVKKLKQGKIKVIFVVDIFNEGVDIPDVDTVMFLRPTESYIVFLQQLGRGLRKTENKKYLSVLDFIGNYKKAHHVPFLLAGQRLEDLDSLRGRHANEIEYPDECQVNFDFRLIDLFSEMRKNDPLCQRLKDEYGRLQYELGRRPTRLDIFEGSDIPLREFLKPDGWLGFLASVEQLTEEEARWKDTFVAAFLREIEQTNMTKSYKIPTLLCFINPDFTWNSSVDSRKISQSWRQFYARENYFQDMARHKVTKVWEKWSDEKLAKHAIQNPVKYLSNTGYFHYDEINQQFYLDDSLIPFLSEELAKHFYDILIWRTRDYFRKRF